MDFGKFVEMVGFPAACLAVLAFSIYKGVVYLVTQILKPIADRHMRFIDHMERSQGDRDQAMTTQTETLRQIAKLQADQSGVLREQNEILKRIGTTSAVSARIATEEKQEKEEQKSGVLGKGKGGGLTDEHT